MRILIVLVALLMVMGMASASAKPAIENGVGFMGGIAYHRAEGLVTSGVARGTPIEFYSYGPSLGVDYQFVFSNSITLNPFVLFSHEILKEKTNVFVEPESVDHGILGLQARFWRGALFLGGHVGLYFEGITLPSREVFSRGEVFSSGLGMGLVVGLQREDGFFILGQYDQVALEGDEVDIDLTGIRLHIGFRVKLGRILSGGRSYIPESPSDPSVSPTDKSP